MWFFPRKYKYRCICFYVWFNDDKHVIWMWLWLILKNISLLDRIWSLWYKCLDCWMFPFMVIFIGVFYYKHQSWQFTGFVYQCRSVLEKIKVTTSPESCKSDIILYQPSLPLYLPSDSISKTRIKVRVSWAGLINSDQELSPNSPNI
jgi:hypothetical protein